MDNFERYSKEFKLFPKGVLEELETVANYESNLYFKTLSVAASPRSVA